MIRIIIIVDIVNKTNYHSQIQGNLPLLWYIKLKSHGVNIMMDSFISKLIMFLMVAVLAGCGSGDNTPPDADGDGVEDALDAFPNDPTETTDTDGCLLYTSDAADE